MPAANASVRTMPKLSPASEGAQSTSASCRWRHSSSPSTQPSASMRELGGRIGQVALHVLVVGADHGQARGHVLGQPLERLHEDRQALSLLRPADEQQPELVGSRLRAQGRGVDVDAVGNDAILAPEPASPGPGGGLRDRDPCLELVELAAGPEQVGDPVGHPLGRVGVEGAHHRGTGEGARVPARASAPAARARGRRRSGRRATRGASWSPRLGRPTGWRRRRWRRSPRCARAGPGSQGGFASRRAPGGAPG